MRKALISLAIVALMLTFPIALSENGIGPYSTLTREGNPESTTSLASAGGSGNSLDSRQYMSRIIAGEQVAILNTYADTAVHYGEIDLSNYLEPSWHIYEVVIDVVKLEAAPEREIVADTNNNSNFQIVDIIGTWHSQLAQGFYKQPHDGQLQNYSVYYSTLGYIPNIRGNASFAITSNYNTSSIITTPLNMTPSELTPIWVGISGENADLDAGKEYWALINGSTLYKGGAPFEYPRIFWYGQDNPGLFSSKERVTDSWDSKNLEALLNYTYVPWNRTAGAALQYSSPESLSLNANSVAQTSLSWTFTNAVSNITSIQFETNQSIYLDYDITIWYQKSPNTTTNWGVTNSGDPIIWNATTVLSYPVFPESTSNYLDITVPSDWTTVGLYNSTYPGTDYGHNSKLGTVVTCTDLADETWVLSSAAPNYVTAIDLSNSLDSSPVIEKVNNSVDIDIDASIEDSLSNPMNGGITNLTVLQSDSQIFDPPVTTATGGLSSFFWDISATAAGNGTHSIEVFWTNGTEAGYQVVDIFVYHATTLVADDMSITAFTENTFLIGIDFDRIFPARGLDGALALVNYDFGSGNQSLNDDGGGRWTASVPTTSMPDGVYNLYVYAEGYALENLSLTISVKLIHETQALNVSWSNSNNILYLESTNLSVTYRMLDHTRITSATVNVTFEGSTYDMAWDPLTETWWIELTGENFTAVPGTIDLNVSAWAAGYESQFDSTITITVGSQTGEDFDVEYAPSSQTISFIQSMTILVNYSYSSNPIQSNTSVRVTFNGTAPVDLIYNSTSLKWEITLLGSNYLGAWDIMVRATADGYTTRTNTTTFIVYEDTPNLSSSWSGDSETTDYATSVPLTITLTDSIGSPITDANISFIAFGNPYQLLTGAGGLYTFNIVPDNIRGIETFTVYVERTGYVSDQIDLNLTVNATTTIDVVHVSSEYEEWNLTVTVTYEDSVYNTAITGAIVTMTLDGTLFTLGYSAGVYTIEIILESSPGSYTIDVSASAQYAVTATSQTDFTVLAKEAVYLEVTFDGNLIAGQFMEIIATLRSNNTGNPPIPGELIRFEVSVYFDNGTVVQYTGPTMTDTTNTEGVASVGFEVPFGNVDRLTSRAIYDGSRTRWNAEITEDAGVDVSPLSLLLAFFTSGVGLMIVLAITLLGIVATGYNRTVKPRKKAARKGLENQLQMFRDLETVQHFMAVYLDRGTCVFYHPFTEERIQPDLISGFIAAITSVYGEIKGDGVRGTLEEIQYHGLRLNSYSGQYIIGILILGGEMTPLLRDRLQFFVELFENQYDQDLDGWTGVVDCFDPEWVVSTLNSAFNYAWHLPHRFGPTQKVSKLDAKVLDYIGAARDERGEFYLKNLLKPLSEMLDRTEAQVLDRLLHLQDRGVIVPIGIQTILQRQGLTLADGSEEILRPIEELEYEMPEEEEEVVETVEEPPVKPEPELDPMEAFVQDVESILQKEAEEEAKKEDKEEEQ